MKRLFILLVMSALTFFSAKAFALEVKFSGEFHAAGVYLDKINLTKDVGPSTAFYFQRLRVRTDFVVSPGLSLVTRFDAMERSWGAARSAPGTTLMADSAGSAAENENIVFDWAYVNFNLPFGVFDIGIMNDGSTGTVFGNSTAPAGRIRYAYRLGPWTFNAAITKVREANYTAKTTTVAQTDVDNDKYGVEAIYRWKDGRAGAQFNYYRYANTRPAPNHYNRLYYLLTPYVIAKIGPVALEAEFNYCQGEDKYENGNPNIKHENISAYIDATATFKPFYVGATFGYVSGDDPNTADKREGGLINGGRDWSPTLIMWNFDRAMWIGNLESTATTGRGFASAFANGYLYQARVGVRPTDKLDIMASFTYSVADKKPLNYISDRYGHELDVTATYRITKNLSYMVGAGYLWTGDYFKGTTATANISDNYLLINKLTLTF